MLDVILQIQKDVNHSKLMDELLSSGLITPLRPDGTSSLQDNELYISDETRLSEINEVIDKHDPSPLPKPETPEQRITALEDENAFLALELATAQSRLDQTEQEQAELLLLLVSEGVI